MEEVRLIDANALMDSLEQPFNWNNSPEEVQEIADYKYFVEAIIAAPTIEAEPVRHGRWIHDINNLYGCSECLRRETMSPKRLKQYCPHCGAKMDAKE